MKLRFPHAILEDAEVLPDGAGVPEGDDREGPLPITVVIAAYNRADLLPGALAGVRAQTRPPAETIVVDDGSADDSAEVAERLGARVIRHPENRGLSAARNTGVEAATQAWIAVLDSDDRWLPHHLETLWSLRDGHVLVTGSSLRCGSDPARDRFHGPVTRGPVVLHSPASLIYPSNYIPVSAALVRRDAVLAAGGFRSHHGVVEDLDMWVRVLDQGTGVASPSVNILYAVHDTQMSGDHVVMQAGHLSVGDTYRGRPWWSPRLVERWAGTADWDNLVVAARRGERGEALRHALTFLRRPQRAFGVAGMLGWRLFVRRRSSRYSRDGGPSVAIMPGAGPLRERALELAGSRRVFDRSGEGGLAALVQLVRRPAGLAVVGSGLQAAVARLAGVRPLRSEADLEVLASLREGLADPPDLF